MKALNMNRRLVYLLTVCFICLDFEGAGAVGITFTLVAADFLLLSVNSVLTKLICWINMILKLVLYNILLHEYSK